MSFLLRCSGMCAASVVCLVGLAACATTIVDPGSGTTSGGTGGFSEGPPISPSSGAGAGGNDTTTGAGGGSGGGTSGFSSHQVLDAQGTCDLPHGPAVTPTTVDAVTASLVGAWVTCPSSTSATTPMNPGISLYPNGTFATLVTDGSGGFVAGQGVTSTGQWWVECETDSTIPGDSPCSEIVVRLQTYSSDTSTAGCFGGPVSFEQSPRRMLASDAPAEWCDPEVGLEQIQSWLVPLQ